VDIDTLVKDIYSLFGKDDTIFTDKAVEAFGGKLGSKIASRISEEQSKGSLRISNLGTRCRRKLWYTVNRQDAAEPLDAPSRIKFLYGDILEEMILFLAKEAGHDVQYEQMEVDLFGVPGHIDAIVDGMLLDVKSASSASFTKFANHLTDSSDSFGYLTQLNSYANALIDFEGLKNKRQAAFLAVDKTLGKLVLDIHPIRVLDYKSKVETIRAELSKKFPPPRGFEDEAFGKSGNRGLGVVCSYCDFKRLCWPGLRTFKYSTGPEFLTHVVRTPDVPEV